MITKIYLPISVKQIIIESVCQKSLVEKNGMKTIDYIGKQLALDLSILQFYTDLDIENSDLDSMYESGEMDSIRKQIPDSELKFIEDNISLILSEEKEIFNSIGGVINRNLQSLIAKIPDEKGIQKILKSIPKTLDKISPENKELFKSFVEGKIK